MTITAIAPGGSRTTCDRAALLSPALREAAREETMTWIKRLRLVRYGSTPMRERFTYRGDSLWWFTELYLHKMRRLEAAVETIVALGAARDAGAARFVVDTRDPASREAAVAFGQSAGVPVDLDTGKTVSAGHAWPGMLVGLTARLSRLRPSVRVRAARRPKVAAFVHTAFWRARDPQGETYIGPILDALVADTARDDVVFVGLGPTRNFRARRWWDPLAAAPESTSVVAIERLAPMRALQESSRLWRARHALAAALTNGPDIRDAAVVRGCDLWPVLRRELDGAALVQWPWSARSMDEAGAALDALEPGVIVTYAEAGGWGRALMLEARRRQIPSVGLQHGFIYRHWLNYRHERDEMAPSGGDAGFPRPDRTLVFDRYAAEYLAAAGNFPETSLAVTGSARLEDLMGRFAGLRDRRGEIRERLGLEAARPVAMVTAKFSEIGSVLPAVVEGASRLPALQLVIKPHPAETAAVYASIAESRPNVRVLTSSADLAEAIAAADVLVTMNSTVAIDALVLGVPSLVVGLPNNLTPFVDAGVMLGADDPGGIQRALESVLYDQRVRADLAGRASVFAARYGLAPEPGAARRAAREILTLAKPDARGQKPEGFS